MIKCILPIILLLQLPLSHARTKCLAKDKKPLEAINYDSLNQFEFNLKKINSLLVQSSKKNNKNEAEYKKDPELLCYSIESIKEFNHCREIFNSGTFQYEAVQICFKNKNFKDKSNCLNMVKDKKFTNAAIKKCHNTSLKSPNHQTKCLVNKL
jgi:hypothetical protein